MPALSGFIGSAYRSQGGFLDNQELYNLYLERAENPNARGPQALLPCPGFELFCTLPNSPLRGLFAQNDRTFAVAGTGLYEIYRDGTFVSRAFTSLASPVTPTVSSAPLPVAIATPDRPTLTHGGVLGSTTYGYKVAATTQYGETTPSDEATSSSGNATLSATNYNLVGWNPVDGATGYNIYRTTGGPGTPPRLVGVVNANTLQFIDIGYPGLAQTPSSTNTTGGVIGSTAYGYKITALIGAGETAASPEGLTVTGQSELSESRYNEITWPPVTGATSYNVYRTTGGVSPPRLIGSVSADGENTLSFRDTGEEGESVTPPSTSTAGLATIEDDGSPVQIHSSGDAGNQLLIIGGGSAFCYDLTTNALAQVVEGATAGGYIGTYFVILDAGSSTLKVSESLDGFTWDPTQVYQRQIAGDRWLSMAVTDKEIWLLGSATSEVWIETGDDETRFAPYRPVFIEQGIIAPNSVARLQGTLLWIAQSKDGAGMVVRTDGYSPRQVSTRGMELQLESLDTLADAIAWTYEQEGHGFYVVTFPNDDVTWCYDTLTQEWHKRAYWDPNDMVYTAYRPQCHAFAFGGLGFGVHLVGDRASGRVLEMRTDIMSDVDGKYIRRLRQGPHILQPGQGQIYYDEVVLDVQLGLGLNTGQGEDPQVMLQWSDDGGDTWSHEHWRTAHRQGIRWRRVKWNRLGRGRNRVFRVVMTDPIPWRLAGMNWEGLATAA